MPCAKTPTHRSPFTQALTSILDNLAISVLCGQHGAIVCLNRTSAPRHLEARRVSKELETRRVSRASEGASPRILPKNWLGRFFAGDTGMKTNFFFRPKSPFDLLISLWLGRFPRHCGVIPCSTCATPRIVPPNLAWKFFGGDREMTARDTGDEKHRSHPPISLSSPHLPPSGLANAKETARPRLRSSPPFDDSDRIVASMAAR